MARIPSSLAPQRRRRAVIRASLAAQACGDGAQPHIPRATAETARAVIRSSPAAQACGDGVRGRSCLTRCTGAQRRNTRLSALHPPRRRAGTVCAAVRASPAAQAHKDGTHGYPRFTRRAGARGRCARPFAPHPLHRRTKTEHTVIRASPAAQARGDGVRGRSRRCGHVEMPLNTMLEWVFRVRASRRCGHVEMNRLSSAQTRLSMPRRPLLSPSPVRKSSFSSPVDARADIVYT